MLLDQNKLKQSVAEAAVAYVKEDSMVGVGSGSTVDFFIDYLATVKHQIEGAVASSEATAKKLKEKGIPVYDLNTVSHVPIYFDGADEINPHLQMIKGGGGALTREKILAAASSKMICMADESKWVPALGAFPLAVEVIPMARSYVARELVKLGGEPEYRTGFVTDNGNIILDVYHLKIHEPIHLEETLNNITGVVANGLFAKRCADLLLLSTQEGIKVYGN